MHNPDAAEAAPVTRKADKNSSGFLYHDSSIYPLMKVMKCQLFLHVWKDLAQRLMSKNMHVVFLQQK